MPSQRSRSQPTRQISICGWGHPPKDPHSPPNPDPHAHENNCLDSHIRETETRLRPGSRYSDCIPRSHHSIWCGVRCCHPRRGHAPFVRTTLAARNPRHTDRCCPDLAVDGTGHWIIRYRTRVRCSPSPVVPI